MPMTVFQYLGVLGAKIRFIMIHIDSLTRGSATKAIDGFPEPFSGSRGSLHDVILLCKEDCVQLHFRRFQTIFAVGPLAHSLSLSR